MGLLNTENTAFDWDCMRAKFSRLILEFGQADRNDWNL